MSHIPDDTCYWAIMGIVKIGKIRHENTLYMNKESNGGSRKVDIPSLGPISFIFMQVLAKILPNNRFCAKLKSWYSPFGKSWIRHCILQEIGPFYAIAVNKWHSDRDGRNEHLNVWNGDVYFEASELRNDADILFPLGSISATTGKAINSIYYQGSEDLWLPSSNTSIVSKLYPQ